MVKAKEITSVSSVEDDNFEELKSKNNEKDKETKRLQALKPPKLGEWFSSIY